MQKLSFLVAALLYPAVSLAAEPVFVDKAGEIVEQMLRDDQSFGRSRSFVIEQSRSIRVRAKNRDNFEENMVIEVKESDIDRSARLKVEFDVNSANMRPSAAPLLGELAQALTDERIGDSYICIKGHTDSDGAEEYNLKLSYERAKTVTQHLQGILGGNAKRIEIIGYGENLPLVANINRANRQKNRRVEVSLNCWE